MVSALPPDMTMSIHSFKQKPRTLHFLKMYLSFTPLSHHGICLHILQNMPLPL